MPISFLKLMFAAALAIAIPAVSQAAQPFGTAAFEQAQSAGKSVLIHVHAKWCSVCKVQSPVVQQLEQGSSQLTVFEVDFDKAKDVLSRLGVRYQSTLIMYKGAKEVGRSTGVTDPAQIRELVGKGL